MKCPSFLLAASFTVLELQTPHNTLLTPLSSEEKPGENKHQVRDSSGVMWVRQGIQSKNWANFIE